MTMKKFYGSPTGAILTFMHASNKLIDATVDATVNATVDATVTYCHDSIC